MAMQHSLTFPGSLREAEAAPTDRRWDFVRRLGQNRGAVIGLALLLLIVAAAVAAPLLTDYDPIKINPPARNQPPNREHWLGTDQFGRDLFSRVVYGARISLPVGLIAVAIAAAVGMVLGLLAGYYGKLVDGSIMRLIDVMLAFPGILLALVVVAILAAAGLSFLRLGAQPPEPEWGAMLADGRKSLNSAWWISTMPGLAIALTVLAVNMTGDGPAQERTRS